MPVTNIPSARRIANIAVNDAMILPYDAIQGPDGIFRKDSWRDASFLMQEAVSGEAASSPFTG
jgi:hypothetical protein